VLKAHQVRKVQQEQDYKVHKVRLDLLVVHKDRRVLLVLMVHKVHQVVHKDLKVLLVLKVQMVSMVHKVLLVHKEQMEIKVYKASAERLLLKVLKVPRVQLVVVLPLKFKQPMSPLEQII
jgi:hypothetical protein